MNTVKLFLVCCAILTQAVLEAAPQAQPVTQLLSAGNEYGGKTWVTSQFPKGYSFQYGRHALPRYINTAGEKFELCTFPGQRYERIIHAYDADGRLRQEEFIHHPESEATRRMGIVSETAHFPAYDNSDVKFFPPMEAYLYVRKRIERGRPLADRLVVRFSADEAKKTGRLSGTYHFDFSTRFALDPESLAHGLYLLYNQYGEGWNIKRYSETCTPEWTERTGVVQRLVFPEDGTRNNHFGSRIRYVYRNPAPPATGRLTDRLFRKPEHFPTHGDRSFYREVGSVREIPGNNWGGRTIVSEYHDGVQDASFRGIRRIESELDARGTRRRVVIEGSGIHDKYWLSFRTGETACFRVIALFDSAGAVQSEETFHDPKKNRQPFNRSIKYFAADGAVRGEIFYPDTSCGDEERQLSFSINRYGTVTARSWRPAKFEQQSAGYDRVENSLSPALPGRIQFAVLPPWKQAEATYEQAGTLSLSHFNGTRLVRTASEPSPVRVTAFDSILHRVRHTPLALTLEYTTLLSYIGAGLTSELEKAFAAWAWVTESMIYFNGKHPQRNGFLSLRDNRYGVCADYSGFFNKLAAGLGLESMYADGYTIAAGEHAWNLVRIDGALYPLDATWKWFIKHPEEMLESHWPTYREHQCISPPWPSYLSFLSRKGKSVSESQRSTFQKLRYTSLQMCPYNPVIEVMRNGTWWTAFAKEIKNGMYHVHYLRAVWEMDEWVPASRVRPQAHSIRNRNAGYVH